MSISEASEILFSGVGAMLNFVLGLGLYIYIGVAVMNVSRKLKYKHGWLIFIPIANLFLILKLARMSYWYFLAFLIPVANIVLFAVVWMKISDNLKKPGYWGILMVVPVVNLVAVGYLAWSERATSAPSRKK